MPTLLVGVNIGVLFNTLLPAWLITILLLILIAYLTVQSSRKGVAQRRRETAAKATQRAARPQPRVEQQQAGSASDGAPAASRPFCDRDASGPQAWAPTGVDGYLQNGIMMAADRFTGLSQQPTVVADIPPGFHASISALAPFACADGSAPASADARALRADPAMLSGAFSVDLEDGLSAVRNVRANQTKPSTTASLNSSAPAAIDSAANGGSKALQPSSSAPLQRKTVQLARYYVQLLSEAQPGLWERCKAHMASAQLIGLWAAFCAIQVCFRMEHQIMFSVC